MKNRVSEQSVNVLCPDITEIIKLGKGREKEIGAIVRTLISSSVIV